ncbi:MAG TPA: hypothetical protein VII46_08790, partial [Acidimicrobiales bacterium]
MAGAALVVGGFLAAPALLTAGAVGASTPVAPSVIAAPTDCPTYAASFGANVVTVRFSFNKNAQTWVVPSNAIPNSICVDASGGP